MVLVVDGVSRRKVRPDLAEYADLIEGFIDWRIPVAEFEARYLRLVKDDDAIHGELAFGVIDELFFYVDEYFDDPEAPDDERELEEQNLRSRAAEALDTILQISE